MHVNTKATETWTRQNNPHIQNSKNKKPNSGDTWSQNMHCFKTHQCMWTTKQLRHEADKAIHTLKTRKHLWQLKHEPDTTRTFLTFSKGIRANKLSILFHANRAEATPILIHATLHNLFQMTQGSPLSSCLSVYRAAASTHNQTKPWNTSINKHQCKQDIQKHTKTSTDM